MKILDQEEPHCRQLESFIGMELQNGKVVKGINPCVHFHPNHHGQCGSGCRTNGMWIHIEFTDMNGRQREQDYCYTNLSFSDRETLELGGNVGED